MDPTWPRVQGRMAPSQGQHPIHACRAVARGCRSTVVDDSYPAVSNGRGPRPTHVDDRQSSLHQDNIVVSPTRLAIGTTMTKRLLHEVHKPLVACRWTQQCRTFVLPFRLLNSLASWGAGSPGTTNGRFSPSPANVSDRSDNGGQWQGAGAESARDKLLRRILVFAPSFYPAVRAGGPARSLTNLVRELESEFIIDVVTSDRDLGRPNPSLAFGAKGHTWADDRLLPGHILNESDRRPSQEAR